MRYRSKGKREILSYLFAEDLKKRFPKGTTMYYFPREKKGEMKT